METWTIGKGGNCVITNNDEGLPVLKGYSGEEVNKYYGGALVCDCVYRKKDAALISAAPDLLNASRIGLEIIQILLPVYETHKHEDEAFEQYISDLKDISKTIEEAIDKATIIK